jgi:calcineurin-like phosphoesterase family protein
MVSVDIDDDVLFTSDWHLYHRRIPTYCRRLDFMNDGEKKNFFDAENRIADIVDQLKRCAGVVRTQKILQDRLNVARQEMRNLRYSQETIEYMNSTIIDNCNAVARPDAHIILAGDVIFGEMEQLIKLRERIICRNIHLVLGNHDKDIRRAWGRGELKKVFRTCQEVATFNIRGQKVWVSHYAHVVWNGSHHGVWHCYGHSHNNLEKWREEHLPHAKMVDVGIDYRAKLGKGYTLWKLNELRKYMDLKDGQSVDHHGSDQNDS